MQGRAGTGAGRVARRVRYMGPAALLIAALAAGCSPIRQNHGYVPDAAQLSELTIGRDTRDRVIEVVGAPASEGMQRGETWYYVSSRRQTIGLRAPRETERQIVAISFAESGTLTNIERFGLEDGRVVTLSRRVTETAVPDLGFLRQVFGNLGSPQAGDFLQ